MPATSTLIHQIHTKALEVSGRYKRTEAELIEVLQQVEDHRVFLQRGHSSLFDYVTRELGLGESLAYSLISVARRAREVPELKTQIQTGKMTLSNARRVVPVLTHENRADHSEWIQKAIQLSSRQLEKEIVKVKPQVATPERASYVSVDRVKLELGISERDILSLRRAQDLLSQSRRRAVSLEETLVVLTTEFLRRNDPLEKAKRHQVRKGSNAALEASQTQEATVAETEASRATGEVHDGESRASKSSSSAGVQSSSSRRAASSAMTLPQRKTSASLGKLVTRVKLHRREPIPASVIHQVNLRDQRRCAHQLPNGSRCNRARWIDLHHIVPISEGGAHTINNLITLCSSHHKLWHLRRSELKRWGKAIS